MVGWKITIPSWQPPSPPSNSRPTAGSMRTMWSEKSHMFLSTGQTRASPSFPRSQGKRTKGVHNVDRLQTLKERSR